MTSCLDRRHARRDGRPAPATSWLEEPTELCGAKRDVNWTWPSRTRESVDGWGEFR
jgi:hypothetical protein